MEFERPRKTACFSYFSDQPGQLTVTDRTLVLATEGVSRIVWQFNCIRKYKTRGDNLFIIEVRVVFIRSIICSSNSHIECVEIHSTYYLVHGVETPVIFRRQQDSIPLKNVFVLMNSISNYSIDLQSNIPMQKGVCHIPN